MKSNRSFGHTNLLVSPVGLGCSRLGSVLGASIEEAETLLKVALDSGINFFDTSSVYAQGESEKLLGRVMAGRQDVIICTKVGKYLPLEKKLILPFRSLIKNFAQNSQTFREGVRQSRTKGMPANWGPSHLRKSVELSLRRLERDYVHVLMLHSPNEEVIRRGEAIGVLADLQVEGKAIVIGVSVDDVGTASAALADTRIQALQIPFHPGVNDYNQVVSVARNQGVAVVAREILGGPNVIGKQMLQGPVVAARLTEAVSSSGVSLALLGTTRTTHLTEAISGFL